MVHFLFLLANWSRSTQVGSQRRLVKKIVIQRICVKLFEFITKLTYLLCSFILMQSVNISKANTIRIPKFFIGQLLILASYFFKDRSKLSWNFCLHVICTWKLVRSLQFLNRLLKIDFELGKGRILIAYIYNAFSVLYRLFYYHAIFWQELIASNYRSCMNELSHLTLVW